MGWVNFLHPDDAEGYLAAYTAAYTQRCPFGSEAASSVPMDSIAG